ncbi:hypothetical protein ASG76_14670 [Nocardioides sp. Soil774]|nr:hypothetical protein ASG76_14670 [Nocardioides sp. Soil774]
MISSSAGRWSTASWSACLRTVWTLRMYLWLSLESLIGRSALFSRGLVSIRSTQWSTYTAPVRASETRSGSVRWIRPRSVSPKNGRKWMRPYIS